MDIALILQINYSDSEYALVGNPTTAKEFDAALTWFSKTPKPSFEEMVSQWPSVQFASKCVTVSNKRYSDYVAPNGSDAVFMKFQRGEATKQEWLDAVNEINAANPYPVKG